MHLHSTLLSIQRKAHNTKAKKYMNVTKNSKALNTHTPFPLSTPGTFNTAFITDFSQMPRLPFSPC